MGGEVRLVIDPVALAEVMRSPQGPVVRRLMEDAQLVKAEAQRLVGVYQPPDAYAAANRQRRPGTLRDSIVTRVRTNGNDVSVEVGSEDPIALWHHEGTSSHDIVARTKPLLVFFSSKAGHVISLPVVHHPGTKPRRFLTEALEVLRGRY